MTSKKAVAYTRISSQPAEGDENGFKHQEEAIRKACAERGYEVVQVFQEVGSRSALDRPELEKAIRAIKDGEADILMATTMDRLSGDSKHVYLILDEVEEAGGRLEFVDQDTPEVRFLQSIRAFLAEVEVERLSRRAQQGIGENLRPGTKRAKRSSRRVDDA